MAEPELVERWFRDISAGAINPSSRPSSRPHQTVRPASPRSPPVGKPLLSSPPQYYRPPPKRPSSSSPTPLPQRRPDPIQAPVVCARCAACRTCHPNRPEASSSTDSLESSGSTQEEEAQASARKRRRPRKSNRRSPTTAADKLYRTYQEWDRWRWDLGDHIYQSFLHRDTDKYLRHRWKKFVNWLQTEHGKCIWVDRTTEEREILFQACGGWDYVSDVLIKELEGTSTLPALGQWEPETEDITAMIEGLGRAIVEKAPYLSALLYRLGVNSRVGEGKYPVQGPEDARYARKLTTIFSILLFSKHSKTNNRFPVHFGLHLLHSGTKGRSIAVLAGMGLCPSLPTLEAKQKGLKDHALQQVRLVSKHYSRIYGSWDNFDYKDGRRHERIGHVSKFQSITTAMICVDITDHRTALPRHLWREHHLVDPKALFTRMISGQQLHHVSFILSIAAVLLPCLKF